VNSRRSGFVGFNSAALVLLTIVLLVSGGASAKDHKLKGSENQAHVVAHISFAGLSAVDMAMQKKVNDKYHLYAALKRPGHLDYRHQQARSSESRWSNPVAGSSSVEQDESDG